MSLNPGLFSSDNIHYCSPPAILEPMRRVLVPNGASRTLIDPGSNRFSQVGAHFTADGISADGLVMNWRLHADGFYCNPEYGRRIRFWTAKLAYWGGEVGMPGIALLPSRTDPAWMQEDIYQTASAWVCTSGRLTFLLPIPLNKKDAGPPKKDTTGKDLGPYYLKRWFPEASNDALPDGFSLVESGLAVGPELNRSGKPQPAPFPSMIPFWEDRDAVEPDPRFELEQMRDALAELVRSGAGTSTRWSKEAERLLGAEVMADRAPTRWDIFDAIADAAKIEPVPHAVNVRRFAKYFGSLGVLTVRKGPYAGVYPQRVKA